MFLVQGWIPVSDYFFSYKSASLSVSTELFFYLSFTLLIFNFNKTYALKIIIALLLVFCMVEIAYLTGVKPYNGLDWSVSTLGLLYINPLTRIFEFTLGMGAALAFSKLRFRFKADVINGTAVEVIVIIIFLLNVSFMPAIKQLGLSLIGPPVDIWLDKGAATCISVAMLLPIMALERGLISRIIGSRTGVFLGELSFAIYLVHYVLLRAYTVRSSYFAEWPSSYRLSLFFILLLCISLLMHLFIEKPVRKVILKFFTGARIPQCGQTFAASLTD